MFWNDYWWIVLLAILVLPIISVALFALWISSRQDFTPEIQTQYWDVFIKLISAFTVVVSGAMLFGKYIDQQEALEKSTQQELNRELVLKEAEFLRQKLNYDTERHDRAVILLGEAKRLSAKLASLETPDEQSLTRFDELYYADLIGVEKRGGIVEQAMVAFREELKKDSVIDDKNLKQLSLDLSISVEIELKESQENLLSQHQYIVNLFKPSS